MVLPLILLGALGALSLFGGARTLREARGFRSRARRTSGIILGIHTDRHNDQQTTYPVLRFHTIEGAEVETTSNVNEGPFYLTRMRGRQVPVLYDPADPRKACIDGRSGRGQVRSGYGIIGLGVVFLLAATGYVVFTFL
ncbi:DUF3592 domain-containing protein [Actinomadura sp. DC4]|uniref:DUF3592 domain-containing protein n=1 Tax=Actinomadura sp. DC4 TaxID=3055069 RepID=UPI0025B04B55|nr:DUF3592 domain-containing protein [Actinomadura sp. DC4]MDN3356888.1 DUF3592 domain-containing protein [Actinomadura sp. DC4]